MAQLDSTPRSRHFMACSSAGASDPANRLFSASPRLSLPPLSFFLDVRMEPPLPNPGTSECICAYGPPTPEPDCPYKAQKPIVNFLSSGTRASGVKKELEPPSRSNFPCRKPKEWEIRLVPHYPHREITPPSGMLRDLVWCQVAAMEPIIASLAGILIAVPFVRKVVLHS